MKNKNKTLSLILTSLILQSLCSHAAEPSGMKVTEVNSPSILAKTLVGDDGITMFDFSYSGIPGSSGTFTNGTNAISMESGIILSTGKAKSAEITKSTELASNTGNGTHNDADLKTLLGTNTIADAAVLEFKFKTNTGDLHFEYVFASEEYNQYVNSSFNDGFALLLDGENIALLPNNKGVVSINNVNNGQTPGKDVHNPEYFIDNILNSSPKKPIIYNGFTVLLTVSLTGLAVGEHTMKFVVADVGDPTLDSAIFIKAGSFKAEEPPALCPLERTHLDFVSTQNAMLESLSSDSLTGASLSVSDIWLNETSLFFHAGHDKVDWSGTLDAYAYDFTKQALKEKPAFSIHTILNEQFLKCGHETRSIYTYNGKNGVPLAAKTAFLEDGLTNDQKFQLISNSPFKESYTSWETLTKNSNDKLRNVIYLEELLSYVAGNQALEPETNCRDKSYNNASRYPDIINKIRFKARQNLLGDIINASPLYSGKPNFLYNQSIGKEYQAYGTFKQTHQNRKPLLLAGANDGFFHIFDAQNGNALFSYAPSYVLPTLTQHANIKSPATEHLFGVDGNGVVVDAYVNNSWKTLYTGGLGAGGQGIFALDITFPNQLNEDSILWEFTDAHDPDLGFTYGKPSIVKIGASTSSQWAAIFGNGYANDHADDNVSQTGQAALFIVLLDKAGKGKHKYIKLQTHTGFKQNPDQDDTAPTANGLAEPSIVDLNGDHIADLVYAGDLYGNVWRFDLRGDMNGWQRKVQRIFKAQDSSGKHQPITSKIEVGTAPTRPDHVMLYFGTGKLLSVDDILSTSHTQNFYGVIDTFTNQVLTPNNLAKNEIISSSTTEIDGEAYSVRHITSRELDYMQDKEGIPKVFGWSLPLTDQGERVIQPPTIRNGRIIFTTLSPSVSAGKTCSQAALGGWLMEIDRFTGNPLITPPFVDKNGQTIGGGQGGGQGGDSSTVAGINSNEGAPSIPAIVRQEGNKHEQKMSASSSGKIMTIGETVDAQKVRASWRKVF